MSQYIHLGEDTAVHVKDVVAIIDLDSTVTPHITRDFLRVSEEEGFVVNVSMELPKSAVICQRNNVSTVYISQISPTTLLKRSEGNVPDKEQL